MAPTPSLTSSHGSREGTGAAHPRSSAPPSRRAAGALAAAAAALAGLGACLDPDELPARWSYVHAAVLAPACTTAGCHSTLTAAAGVTLADREGAYTVLTGRICGEPPRPGDPPRNFVTPYSAAYSQLVYQLRGADAAGRPYRDVMPPDAPLPAAEIALVARWIDEGARCD
jgi:hypothetical protein